MAWNQNNQDEQKPEGERPDPWGRSKGPKRPPGPPDMEDLLQRLQQALKRLLLDAGDWRLLVLVFPALLALWLVAGFYVVQPVEQGVVLRLGAYSSTVQPGLHWRIPLLDSVRMIEVGNPHRLPVSVVLITADENVVEVGLQLDYRVSDVRRYMDSMADPEALLAHATEAALRHALGDVTLNQALDAGQLHLSADLPALLQADMDKYQTGISVSTVKIAEVHLPKEVQAVADDVGKARVDNQGVLSHAEAKAGQLRAEAHTQASQMLADASAYRTEAVDRAQGEADRLAPLLVEFHKSPAMVREHLYMDTMESILGKVTTVIVGDKSINPTIYLSGDKSTPRAVAAAPATSGKSTGKQP